MNFDTLVQKRMFLLLILILMISTYFGGTEPVGVNKTVHWQWDLSNWVLYLKNWSLLLFGFGYGIVALLGHSTNKTFSIIHLVILLLLLLVNSTIQADLAIIVILHIISLVVFFVNLLWTINNRSTQRKNQ